MVVGRLSYPSHFTTVSSQWIVVTKAGLESRTFWEISVKEKKLFCKIFVNSKTLEDFFSSPPPPSWNIFFKKIQNSLLNIWMKSLTHLGYVLAWLGFWSGSDFSSMDPGPTFHRWIQIRLFIFVGPDPTFHFRGPRSDLSFSWVQIRLFIDGFRSDISFRGSRSWIRILTTLNCSLITVKVNWKKT